MKKLVLGSLFLAALAGTASASLVSPCAVLMLPNSTGNTSSTCSVTPDAGDFISSLTLSITDDYTGYQSGNPTVTYSGTLSQSSAVFGAPTFCNVTTENIVVGPPAGGNSVPCTVTGLGTVTGLDLSSYNVNITGAGNSLTGGVVTGASEVMTLAYTESPIVVSGVPEPSTLSMLGGALLGLGFLGRKKKA